jgi:hypothetical protein
MNLLRRLEALEKEKEFAGESIILHMPDGRSETLPGHNNYALDLFTCATRGERTLELELIAQSISSTEPGGAHMIDLVRVLLNGPQDGSRIEQQKKPADIKE